MTKLEKGNLLLTENYDEVAIKWEKMFYFFIFRISLPFLAILMLLIGVIIKDYFSIIFSLLFFFFIIKDLKASKNNGDPRLPQIKLYENGFEIPHPDISKSYRSDPMFFYFWEVSDLTIGLLNERHYFTLPDGQHIFFMCPHSGNDLTIHDIYDQWKNFNSESDSDLKNDIATQTPDKDTQD